MQQGSAGCKLMLLVKGPCVLPPKEQNPLSSIPGSSLHFETHEAPSQTMNVAGRFRYATLPGIADFYRWEVVQSIGAGLKVRTGAR